jgi:phosphoglycerate dehydrogenase-like enzyme
MIVSRPHVWIPEDAPVAVRDRLAALAELHEYPPTGPLGVDDRRADILLAGQDSRRALGVAGWLEGLSVIQVFSAGVDAIVDRMPAGVTLCDATGVHDIAVAEWVVMTMLVSRRRLAEHLEAQHRGTWRDEPLVGQDLDEATVLILGAGSIGRAVEARLTPFRATVVRVARRPREGVHGMEDLPSLLPAADVVVNLLPLTPQTRGLIDADVIAAMRPGALLVNASRGAIVDTAAMTAAVLDGRIRVALDVTDPEPLPAGHPLWSAPGAIVTPHVASDVSGEDDRAWALAVAQVGRFARGEPLANVVADGY